MRDEAVHQRVELVSGRDATETWKETNASSLKPMFKTFRKEFASELTTRFTLDSTPDKHTLLALAMNPSLNTTSSSPLLTDKRAMYEMLVAEYKRALRRQAVRLAGVMRQPAPAEESAPEGGPREADAAAPDAPDEPPVAPKRRKSLLGSVTAQQLPDEADADASEIDVQVQAEIERFGVISQTILAAGEKHPYYEGKARASP